MTYKKMAEEWVTVNTGFNPKEPLGKIAVRTYLAGLEAGRPQWHKVADGDLPKDNRYILIATRTDVYRGFYENNNWYGDEGGRLRCIAWKEIIPPKESEK